MTKNKENLAGVRRCVKLVVLKIRNNQLFIYFNRAQENEISTIPKPVEHLYPTSIISIK